MLLLGLLLDSAAEELAYSVIQSASPTINLTLTNRLIASAPYHHNPLLHCPCVVVLCKVAACKSEEDSYSYGVAEQTAGNL